jgi:hypothetical protein
MKDKILFGIVDPQGAVRWTSGYFIYGSNDEHTLEMVESNWQHFKVEVPQQYPGSVAIRTTAQELLKEVECILPDLEDAVDAD